MKNHHRISLVTLVLALIDPSLLPAVAASTLAPGAYFELKLPGETPELFAPGIINIPGRSVGHIAFSPDDTECAFTVFEGFYNHNRILYTHYEKGGWTLPAPLPGIDGKEMLEPLFSRDNQHLYFTARLSDDQSATDFWEMPRTPDGWGKSQLLPAPLNSPQRDFCLAETADGTMYFASDRAGGNGGLDLYRTSQNSGQSLQVENLWFPVNSTSEDGDPAISPDGQMLVFYSEANRPRRTGNSDLFICFANGKRGWTRPINMGAGFNTTAQEYAATFSQDGRAFFFARFDGKKGEVYWIATGALERFRQQSEDATNLPKAASPLPPEKTAIEVPPEILEHYVGTYELEAPPGLKNFVSIQGNQLMMQIPGQPIVPLFAESDTKFFLKVVEAEIEFLKNGQGEVVALVVHQNGVEINMVRKKDPGFRLEK